MTDILYAQMNLIGIALLLLILNNLVRNGQKKFQVDQNIFNICLIMNILIFVFDTGMWLLDGEKSEIAYLSNNIVTLLYYIFNPLICLMWLIYTDYKINESVAILRKRIVIYAIPCFISAVFSILSLSTGWLYVIDKNNVYSRGPFFWIMAVAAMFYLLLSFGMALWDVIVNGWAENKSVNVHLVIYPIGVILASVLQIMYFGISVIWVSSMIAFVSIYISFQNTEISTDYLTGLFNRRRLDEHFQRKIRMYKKEKLLFALMLDLDDFKKINDDYGHAEGDKALVAIAEILRQVCKGSDDFIVRMGGDEFLIIGERESNEEIKQLMDNISSEASELNERKVHPFQLNPSMGTSIYKSGDTKDSFFVSADKAMYQNKQEQKKLRDRNIYYQI